MKNLLGLVCLLSVTMMSNAAFADFILCQGGQGPDTVLVRFNTCEQTAEIIKQSANLPSYRAICSPADGAILMCQGQDGRTLFLDSPESGRYVGSRRTTFLHCQVAQSGGHGPGFGHGHFGAASCGSGSHGLE